MVSSSGEDLQIFVCYSHADRKWLDRLLVHLAPLRRRYHVEVWSDAQIQAGTKWREAIREAIEACNTAVLLVSADFLASDFIANDELPPLLRAADQRGALIIPVIVAPCLFLKHEELAVFQAANDPALPLMSMDPGASETVFLEVADRLLTRAEHTEPVPSVETPTELHVQEDFLDPDVWTRLIKIGAWVYETAEKRIVGSGKQAFLLSRDEYGEEGFSIETTLAFDPLTMTAAERRLGMNAGVVVGWTHERESPRYYHVLITGEHVMLERIGFSERGRGAEHITDPYPLKIEPGRKYKVEVRGSGRHLAVSIDDKEVLSTDAGPLTAGRVGLRPWRSTLSCTGFTVVRTTS